MKILLFSLFTFVASFSNNKATSTPVNNNENSCTATVAGSAGSASCTSSNCTSALNCAKAGYQMLK